MRRIGRGSKPVRPIARYGIEPKQPLRRAARQLERHVHGRAFPNQPEQYANGQLRDPRECQPVYRGGRHAIAALLIATAKIVGGLLLAALAASSAYLAFIPGWGNEISAGLAGLAAMGAYLLVRR